MSKTPPPDFSRVAGEARKWLNKWGGLGNVAGLTALTGIGLVTAYGLTKSIYFVKGGFRAVKFNCITGLYDTVYDEGANFAIPFLETPVIFDIRNRPIEIPTASGSRDLQTVNMAVRVLYQPDVNQLHNIYRHLGVNYSETVLPSLINEIIRAVIAQFNAADLLQKRPEVSHQIAVMLADRAKRFNIVITDVSITQMSFGKEYTHAVEAKQVAQQMAERAKFRVEQAQQEKEAAILLAKGEAEAATLVGNAVKKNPAFLELRGLEAARRIAGQLKESGRGRYILDSDSLYLNVKNMAISHS